MPEAEARTDGADDLERFRERVFRFVLILTIAFALPSLAFWTYSKAGTGRVFVTLPLWFVYGVFVVLGAARKVAWRTRARVFLACLFLAGAVPILEYGFRSQGPLLLLTAVTVGSVFLGVRASLFLLVASLAAIALGAVLFLTGVARDNATHPLTSLSTWASVAGTFLFIGLCLVATVGVIMRRLETSLGTTRELVQHLREEVAAVETEKAATLRELAERERAERLVEQRDRVLRATGSAAERLLASRRWEDAAPEILAELGEAAGVARATLAELVVDPERGELLCVRYFEAWGEEHWAEHAARRELEVSAAGLEPFVARLRAQEPVVVRRDQLPEAPRRLAEALRMAVGLALPITVGDTLWGFIGFESADPAFALPPPATGMLRAAAGSLGAAIARDRLNAELEERVLERTASLARANDDLRAFTYTVSHDLRAPLRQLGSYVGMLRERARQGLDAEADRYLESIASSERRMSEMIEDLLRFYALGRSELALAEVELHALVEEVIAESRAEHLQRDLKFELANLPVVWVDRALFKHALTNLIGNALKYTRRRAQASVEVGARRKDGELVLSVRDDGVGFDPRYADRLFQVFQRLHPAQEFEGSGIGLAHVKRIVERHGGRVWASGAPDEGATFFVALPESCLVPPRPESRRSAPSPISASAATRHGIS
ncbi:MAG TPA: ATP-binding protein [Polyangiaceae bacterium]